MDNLRNVFQNILEKVGCLDFHVKLDFVSFSHSILSKEQLEQPQIMSYEELSAQERQTHQLELPNWTILTNEYWQNVEHFHAVDELLDWIEKAYGWGNVYLSGLYQPYRLGTLERS
ncbi:hypothetical protein ACQCN2_01305 [Brevibacillus ginsengisoli]|uniref:hypothetical protein n=1 Tax=Brevibacillus ginsengisoli TaxID=363854 RepID=UPI003CF33B88